jgi:hypothetical protein
MRHVIFARPMAARSRRVIDTAATAHLIAAASVSLRVFARF